MEEVIQTPIQNPVTQTPKTNWLLLLLAGMIILVIGIGIGLILGRYSPKPKQITSYEDCMKAKGSSVQESNPPTCVTANGLRFKGPVASPTLTPDPTANWKTYINQQHGFSFKYPSTWKEAIDPNALENENREFRLQTNNNEFVTGTVFDGKADTSNDLTWSKRISLSNNKSLLITYTDNLGPGSKGGSIDIKIFDQILSTFKFINQEDSFCGGFTGAPCPEGYECRYEPNSDGGYCVKN